MYLIKLDNTPYGTNDRQRELGASLGGQINVWRELRDLHAHQPKPNYTYIHTHTHPCYKSIDASAPLTRRTHGSKTKIGRAHV